MKDPTDTFPEVEAVEYEEACGHTNLGGGIAIVDVNGALFCKLTAGTIVEMRLALLWQAAPALFGWACEACEQVRAKAEQSGTEPEWLEKLEAAVRYAKTGPLKD